MLTAWHTLPPPNTGLFGVKRLKGVENQNSRHAIAASGAHMPHVSRFARTAPRRKIPLGLLLAAAILVLLLTRVVPPLFSQASPSYTTISCLSDHQHRLCFDHDGLPWSVPSVAFSLIQPPRLILPRSGFWDSLPLTRETEYQFNRPPPTV